MKTKEIKEFTKQVALQGGDSKEKAEVFTEDTMLEFFPEKEIHPMTKKEKLDGEKHGKR